MVPLVTGNPRDQHPKAKRLIDSLGDVMHADVISHFSKISPFADTKKLHTDEIASEYTDNVENSCEEGQGQNACQKSWNNKVPKGIETHQLDRIDLLGDSHDPYFSGHGRAGPPRDH